MLPDSAENKAVAGKKLECLGPILCLDTHVKTQGTELMATLVAATS